MDRDPWSEREPFGPGEGARGEPGYWIGIENGELLEWFEKYGGGVEVFGFIGPVPGLDELSLGAAADIGLKDFVGIVEVGDDEVEGFEIGGPIGIEFGVAGEKAGEGTGFNGAKSIDEARGVREFGDARVAQDFKVGVGKRFAER